MSSRKTDFPFADPFDQAVAHHGPPAVFTVDHKNQLRLNGDRSRETWTRILEESTPPRPPGEADPVRPDSDVVWCHCLFRDHGTGWVQYILVTSPALCSEHPRADVRRYDNQAQALAALAALGRPPIAEDSWDS